MRVPRDVTIIPPMGGVSDGFYIIKCGATGKQFRLGAVEGQVMTLLQQGDDEAAAAAADNAYGADSWASLLQELSRLGLVSMGDAPDLPARGASSGRNWALVRFPLTGCTRWINSAPFTLFSSAFVHGITLVLIVLAFGLLRGQFAHALFGAPFDRNALLVCVPFLVLSFVVHEMGHAIRLRVAGGTVNAIGAMLWYGMPGLFVDVTDTWRIPGRRDRVEVALAGVQYQIAFGALVAVVWHLTALWILGQPSLGPTYLFLINTGTALSNLLPFGGTDGYWVLATYLNHPSLREHWSRRAGEFLCGHTGIAAAGATLYSLVDSVFPKLVGGAVLWSTYMAATSTRYFALAWIAAAAGFGLWALGGAVAGVLRMPTSKLRRSGMAGALIAVLCLAVLMPVSEFSPAEVVFRQEGAEVLRADGDSWVPGEYRLLRVGSGMLPSRERVGTLTVTPASSSVHLSHLMPGESGNILAEHGSIPLYRALFDRVSDLWRIAIQGVS